MARKNSRTIDRLWQYPATSGTLCVVHLSFNKRVYLTKRCGVAVVHAIAHSLNTGLIKPHVPGSSRTSGFSYSALRKGLKLLVNEPDQMTDTPADVAYLYKVRGQADALCSLRPTVSVPTLCMAKKKLAAAPPASRNNHSVELVLCRAVSCCRAMPPSPSGWLRPPSRGAGALSLRCCRCCQAASLTRCR